MQLTNNRICARYPEHGALILRLIIRLLNGGFTCDLNVVSGNY